MIWIRRLFAVLLGVVFLILFLVSVVLLRVNATFLSPAFLNEELRKADLFTFVYDKVVPQVVEDSRDDIPEPPFGITITPEDVVSAARQVAPPEWLQEQVEGAIGEVVPYLTGDQDHFRIAVPLANRVKAAVPVAKDLLSQSGVYTAMENPEFADEVDRALEDLGELPMGITLSSQDLVSAAQRIAEPQWLQERVEEALDEVVPYLVGDADSFQITVPLADRVEVAVPVVKDLLSQSGVYTVMESPDFADEVGRALEEFGELPLGIALSSQDLVSAAQRIAEPQWLQGQVEGALDEIVPYLLGKTDGFQLTVPLADRVEVAVPVVKDLLRQSNAYEGVLDEVAATIVQEHIGQLLDFPFDVTFTSKEVTAAIKDAVPPEWLQEQVERALDQVVPYLTGVQEHFIIRVPIAGRVEVAAGVIEELAEGKLEEAFAAYPECTLQESLALGETVASGTLPPCHPPGFSLADIREELGIQDGNLTLEEMEERTGRDLTLVGEGITLRDIKEHFHIDVAGEVKRAVGDALPDTYTFTDQDLRGILDPDNEALLDNARETIKDGFTFTDADLRDLLDPEALEMVDRGRETLRDGFTFTDADLRDLLDPEALEMLDRGRETLRDGLVYTDADLRENLLASDGGEGVRTLDQVRSYLGQARRLQFLVYVAWGLLLGSIGLLGGRRWRGRIAWAATFLGLGALIAFIASGPGYTTWAEPYLDKALAQARASAEEGVQLLALEKGSAVAKTVIPDFLAGINAQAAVLLAIAVLAVGLSVAWGTISGLLRRGPPSPPEAGGDSFFQAEDPQTG